MAIEEIKLNEVDPSKVISWWAKNRQKVYAVVILIVGLLGGNVDRLSEIVSSMYPENPQIQLLTDRVDDLNNRVEVLEQNTGMIRLENNE